MDREKNYCHIKEAANPSPLHHRKKMPQIGLNY